MMSWDEVIALLYQDGYVGRRSGFDVLRGMLEYLGSPQEKLRFVHVAGTNGKGSASRMMQEILSRAGYRTGLFISPHLKYMNERWTIDGEMISDRDLREMAGRTREAVASFNKNHAAEEKPVSFALLTMMALDYFARKDCEIVVLEVGIGGRLDSTNVIPVPELALIMNIGLEHTELLGNSVERIAYEKGGIIKPGGEVVLYHQSAEAETVIREICAERGAELTVTEPENRAADCCGEQIRYSYHSHENLVLNLSGRYQCDNMLAVLDGIDVLRRRGLDIPEQAVKEGLANVTWPGRFEILSEKPLVIVDGAHNPNGIEALIRNILDPYGPARGKRILFVVGIMADKDVPEMLRLLAPYAAGFIMETVPSERAESAEELCAQAARYYAGPVTAAHSMRDALGQALRQADDDTAVICCGSLYQAAQIREDFNGLKAPGKGV